MNQFNKMYLKVISEAKATKSSGNLKNKVKTYVNYLNEILNDEELGIQDELTHGKNLESILNWIKVKGGVTKTSNKYFKINPAIIDSKKYGILPHQKPQVYDKVFKITGSIQDGNNEFYWECYDANDDGEPYPESEIYYSENKFETYKDCLNDIKRFMNNEEFMEHYDLYEISRQPILFKDLVETQF